MDEQDNFLKRDEFEAYYKDTFLISGAHPFIYQASDRRRYVNPHTQDRWEGWQACMSATVQPVAHHNDVLTAAEVNPVNAVLNEMGFHLSLHPALGYILTRSPSNVLKEQVTRAIKSLVEKYVQPNGGIAMVAANGEAHPAVREAWGVVANWLAVSSDRQVADDLTAVQAVTGLTPEPRVTNVTNVAPAKLGKFKFPKKETKKVVLKALEEAYENGMFRAYAGPVGPTGAMGMRGAPFEIHVKQAPGADEHGKIIDGDGGTPVVTLSMPCHDGSGRPSIVRFTGLIENMESGQTYLIQHEHQGCSRSPYQHQVEVKPIPE